MVVSVVRPLQAHCVLPVGAHLAEGPHWWAERSQLLWVDIEASRIGLFDPRSGQNSFIDVGCHVGCVVPTAHGDLLAATADGFLRLDPSSGSSGSTPDSSQTEQIGENLMRSKTR